MVSRLVSCALLLPAFLASPAVSVAAAEFVFEGRLEDRGLPANGHYDLRLVAFPDAVQAAALGEPVEFPAVQVRDGHFELRFEDVLDAQEVWLEIAVRDAGATGYSVIPGRSKASAAPLIGACWSSSGDAGTNPASHFLGTTDDQPLNLRANNRRVVEFTSHGTATAYGDAPSVAMGSSANVANATGATVGGGGATRDMVGAVAALENRASGAFATVAGGWDNDAIGQSATVSGGSQNSAIGDSSAVGGGAGNMASTQSTVGGGANNMAAGFQSTVSGGYDNCAGGYYSWAGGRHAKARPSSDPGPSSTCGGLSYPGIGGDQGTFVWADSQSPDFVSTGDNQFLVRAAGGVAINTNQPDASAALTVAGGVSVLSPGALGFGSDVRQMLNLWGTSYGIGIQSDTQYFRAGGQGYFAWYKGGTHHNTGLNPGTGGSLLMTLGPGSGSPTGTARAQSFVNVSDRASKTGFLPVDTADVLQRVAVLPLTSWAYRNQPDVRHIGPVAQDFHAAFGIGEDARTISTVDSAGVALAAIQGLNAKLEVENARQHQELVELRRELAEMRAALQPADRGQR